MSITVTEAAALQIKKSARQGGTEGMALRVAAKRNADGSIEYAMGFDSVHETDSKSEAYGISVVVAPTSTELVAGMTVDYVELEPGQSNFIFLNPNDPRYVPPKNEDKS
jgi:iron-sulfur cluster assembly protein